MNKIKEKCFEILLEFDSVCKKAGLQYYIYGGTLLGAVRHQGFIPWDDDIDIVMFRKDYDQVIDACNAFLNHNKFVLQTIYSDPYASNPWMKLHNLNTAFISGVRRSGAMEGINIDIFPIDNAPDSVTAIKFRGKIIDTLSFIYQYRFQKHNKNASWRMRIFQTLISIIPPWDEMKFKLKYDQYIQKWNDSKTKNVVYLSNRRYSLKVVPRSCFDETVFLKFETHYFPAPKEYSVILNRSYGDNYMELPPEEDRCSNHGATTIDYNCSWTKYEKEKCNNEKI